MVSSSLSFAAALLPLAACAGATRSPDVVETALSPLSDGESGYALHLTKILTVDGDDRVFDGGTILVRGAEIEYVGEHVVPPEGYEELVIDGAWALPGMVDLHSHVVVDGWGDINDMVYPVNPGLSTRPTIRTSNSNLRRACSAGVTTTFLIPGSGTSISGFGVLAKAKTDATYEGAVLRDPGGMKAAQNYNPQRTGDLGGAWCGLAWIKQDINDKAVGALRNGHDPHLDFSLENLMKVHAGELPVLIHCASAEGVANVVRMWKVDYGTECVVSHGSWDGYKAAGFAAQHGVPVNHGPRTMDYGLFMRPGKITGGAKEYVDAGVPLFSLNTDSPIVPQEELFLQGSMSARLGADAYQMVRALTTHPAQSILAGDRIGSLEVGKDADIVVCSGDPLDPRSRVELVLIDGQIEYSRLDDGQWF